MKPLWYQFAVQLLQIAPATATQPVPLNYLFSKYLCLNCSCTLCSASGTSSGELRERLKIWKLPQSANSDRWKYHSYSIKRMTLTDCKQEGTWTDRTGEESSNVHFHCGGHEQAIKHWLSTTDDTRSVTHHKKDLEGRSKQSEAFVSRNKGWQNHKK